MTINYSNLFLETEEYLKMNIVFKSCYGYTITKKVDELTQKEKNYIIQNNFYPIDYIGNLEKNKYHGDGFIFENGNLTCYSQFQMGRKSGITFDYQDEIIIYSGTYKDGRRSGFGQLYELDLEKNRFLVYDGLFHNDKFHGQGVLYSKDHIFKGAFFQNKLNGYARIYDKTTNNVLYQGNLVDNRIEGFGENYIYDNEGYIQMFYRGLFTDGVWEDSNGYLEKKDAIYKGRFTNGTFVHGQQYMFGNLIYNGDFTSSFQYEGNGSLIENEKGTIYVGEFKSGMKDGTGVLMNWDSMEVIYEGEFEKNHMKLSSNEYLQTEYELKKMMELNEEDEESLEQLAKKIKKKHIYQFMTEKDLPIHKQKTKKELLESIRQFDWMDKLVTKNSERSLVKLKKDYMVQYYKHKTKENGRQLHKKNKLEIVNLLKKQHEEMLKQEEQEYDFFGHEIQTPVLGSDGQIYDLESMKKLEEMEMKPTIFNGIPLTHYYTYEQIQNDPEKKECFKNYSVYH